MSKLRLDLDSVTVESFPTAHTAAELRGTIEGRAEGDPSYGGTQECTGDCSGDGMCSWQIQCSRDNCSEFCTGYPGCSEDENCSELEGCTGLRICFWTP
jgi:hypothetical protein